MRIESAGTGIFKSAKSGLAAFAAVFIALAASPVQAAFLFEVDTDGQDDGVLTFNPRFSFGGDTTVASQSATSPAHGATGGDSIFGGDGVNELDTYVYAYAPDSEADNLAIPAATDLGGGNLATGESGGGAGLYNIYATWPFTDNVSGGDTEFAVVTAGDSFTVEIDQNNQGDNWVYIGQIDYSSGDITVTQRPTESNTFISQRAYGLLFEAVDDGVDNSYVARFAVSKSYSDGNTDEVEVTLTCNGGLELVQSFTISEGSPVNFVLTDFIPGEVLCTVTETGGADGYTASFFNGTEMNDSACVFDGVQPVNYLCEITNTLEPVSYTINKEWLFSEEEDGIAEEVYLDIRCENFRQGPDGDLQSGNEQGSIGAEVTQLSYDLFPNWTEPQTRCRTLETQLVSGVESDQGCADWLTLTPGGPGQECTISNTVFYEGIPVLDRAGLAFLALLLLGVGLVAVRRFA